MENITCPECGSDNTRSTDDNEFYYCGESFFCEDCDEYFGSDNDDRSSYLSPATLRIKRDWETDEDYRNRMEDLDNM